MPGPVAVVGVGNMGGAIAARLLEQGWSVRVRDIDASRMAALAAGGAVACASAAEAAAGCGALVVCVVDAAQTQDVLFGAGGAAAALQRGAVVLLCPTIAPSDVERMAARLASLGLALLDAPMSGGPARARDGSMSLMVAGEDAAFEQARTLIDAVSRQVFRIGSRPGDGARTKLVNNLLAGINLAGAAEALAMAQRLGLDLGKTLDVIERSSGQSWIGCERLRRAIAGDYEPRAHVSLLHKDTRLALEAARAAGFEGPLGPTAHGVFEAAMRAGMAGLDDAALFRLLADSHKEPPPSR
jgi:putative dehydrogenase